jgi:hypothetical protein
MTDRLSEERAFAETLMRDFASEGYEAVSPIAGRTEGFVPDLVFRRGEEVVVVEIKSREAHRSVEDLRRLKEAVEKKPNWQFRLYAVPPTTVTQTPEDNLQDVEKLLSTADQLNRDGLVEAASVVLWMVIEIVLRTLLTVRQDRPNPGVSGMSMARSLEGCGELSAEDLEVLKRASMARDLSVHGYRLHPHDRLAPDILRLAKILAKKARSEAARELDRQA